MDYMILAIIVAQVHAYWFVEQVETLQHKNTPNSLSFLFSASANIFLFVQSFVNIK